MPPAVALSIPPVAARPVPPDAGLSTREMLERVVHDERFRPMLQIPLFDSIHLLLVFGSWGVFALSSWAYLEGVLPLVVMIAINSITVYTAFTPYHDGTHRAVSRNRYLNDFLSSLSGFLLVPGVTARIYRYLHLEHHRFVGDRMKDPDDPLVSAHKWLWPFLMVAPDILWAVWYFNHRNSRPFSERLEAAIAYTFYFGFQIAFLLSPYAVPFILVWLIPQRIGITIITTFFAHIQHPAGVAREEAPLQATVVIPTGPAGRLIMLGQNDHGLHHLLPSIPFYRYHDAWRLARTLFDTSVVPTRSFFTPAQHIVMPERGGLQLMRARVMRIRKVARDVRTYEIAPLLGETLPPFEAGAHIDVHIAPGVVRNYSLCNAPGTDNRYLIAVRREKNGRGGSKQIHRHFFEGEVVTISAPRNNFALAPETKRAVLVAGGIGVTPLLSMAHALHAKGTPFTLHICARDKGAVPFGAELSQFPFADAIEVHLDSADGQPTLPTVAALGVWAPGTMLYVCGPVPFMDAVMAKAKALGWPAEALKSESFAPAALDFGEKRAFTVTLARKGKTVEVGEGESLLDVLEVNGAHVPYSCVQGVCGSCVTKVLEGEPDHRDAILTPEEHAAGKKMCVCVSRSKSDHLVLDL